ncbi:unnamed protein product [Peniophora sp. CBMAI 1063]|nr:unnamed protein product [Peniophora sp. CBMAI 1063]
MEPLIVRVKSALHDRPRPTLFGRALLLLSIELLVNGALWAIAGVIFARDPATRPVLGLALLAWTIGLRHALDADHISAIDNATRGLISLGQLPVTCGLFFSLGHSTIVIIVNVAIAISTDIAGKLDSASDIGGIIGASVSASFLFIVGLANSIILYKTLRRRRESARTERAGIDEDDEPHANTITMKILGPIVRFVNKPWKMYPVGVLFGLGFDTASSIALLAASAVAKRDANGNPLPSGYIVILPLLFTAGMTLIDSLDSVLMLYSYAGFPSDGWRLLEPRAIAEARREVATEAAREDIARRNELAGADVPGEKAADPEKTAGVLVAIEESTDRDLRVKRHLMSNLSIILTSMSIVVAFCISLITIMGLIGDNCDSCTHAAEAEDGGGLAGRWWRFWGVVNDNSGYIGAGIVGSFVLVTASWYGGRWLVKRIPRSR